MTPKSSAASQLMQRHLVLFVVTAADLQRIATRKAASVDAM